MDRQGPQDKFWPFFDYFAEPEDEGCHCNSDSDGGGGGGGGYSDDSGGEYSEYESPVNDVAIKEETYDDDYDNTDYSHLDPNRDIKSEPPYEDEEAPEFPPELTDQDTLASQNAKPVKDTEKEKEKEDSDKESEDDDEEQDKSLPPYADRPGVIPKGLNSDQHRAWLLNEGVYLLGKDQLSEDNERFIWQSIRNGNSWPGEGGWDDIFTPAPEFGGHANFTQEYREAKEEHLKTTPYYKIWHGPNAPQLTWKNLSGDSQRLLAEHNIPHKVNYKANDPEYQRILREIERLNREGK